MKLENILSELFETYVKLKTNNENTEILKDRFTFKEIRGNNKMIKFLLNDLKIQKEILNLSKQNPEDEIMIQVSDKNNNKSKWSILLNEIIRLDGEIEKSKDDDYFIHYNPKRKFIDKNSIKKI